MRRKTWGGLPVATKRDRTLDEEKSMFERLFRQLLNPLSTVAISQSPLPFTPLELPAQNVEEILVGGFNQLKRAG